MHDDIKKGLTELLRAAEAMSSDVGASVEEILREGLENPLSADEVHVLLARVVERRSGRCRETRGHGDGRPA